MKLLAYNVKIWNVKLARKFIIPAGCAEVDNRARKVELSRYQDEVSDYL